MLTSLPEVPGLDMAACYHPADSRQHVGGDWYDAAFIPDPQRPGDEILAVCVGDVVGHALQAATVMGQVRAMLRQAAWDHPGEPPSHALTATELATRGLGLAAGRPLFVQRIEPVSRNVVLGDEEGLLCGGLEADSFWLRVDPDGLRAFVENVDLRGGGPVCRASAA